MHLLFPGTHARTHTFTNYLYLAICWFMYTHLSKVYIVLMCTCTHVYVYMYVLMYVHAHVHTHTHAHTHTHTHTHTQTQTHTHTHTGHTGALVCERDRHDAGVLVLAVVKHTEEAPPRRPEVVHRGRAFARRRSSPSVQPGVCVFVCVCVYLYIDR